MDKKEKDVLWFKEINREDIALVGGKGANLGEMVSFGIPVPPGFVVTSKAYFDFLDQNQLRGQIYRLLQDLDVSDSQKLVQASREVKKLITNGKVSSSLSRKIISHYLKLGGLTSQALVAIRSSATAEDLPTASFAGQQVTFLNIKGEANVVFKVKECWASLFEARAIFYRQEKGFDHFQVGIAVPVQKMAPTSISGVMFTIDPVTNRKDRIVIEAIHGLGELIVQGAVTPDRYVVEKKTLAVKQTEVVKQTIQLVKKGNTNRETKVPAYLQSKRKLTDKQVIQLAKIGESIHQHYFFPQDIEWTFHQGKFYIVQTRPVTTIQKSKVKSQKLKVYRQPILKGQAASPGMASGTVRLVKAARDIHKVKKGDVLVASMTSPDFVPAMKKAVAIITDKGGQTSHAAIVSRELGVPCVVGTEKATQMLKNDQLVTVNGSQGEIYKGGMVSQAQSSKLKAQSEKKKSLAVSRDSREAVKTATKIYVNLAEPELASKAAEQNVDGVGLLRAEFMIAEIGIHPRKLIGEKKGRLFTEKLAEGLEKFCQAFYPRPVVYRATDFKTNEYRHLKGGRLFESQEENPLLGFRGAFRYISDPEVFELELKAIKKVREKFNNLWLMIPFVRTPEEFKEVKKIVVAGGLLRSSHFKLWLMVEIPANVILLEEFIKIGLDGVSIGSNDLTMLILGADRDNAKLAEVFNERHPAVLWALEQTIKTCQKHQLTSSICGQAPSFYPDLVKKLVSWGITSISVSPDVIEKTRKLVYRAEREIIRKTKN